uniref:Uncharacterized protein n=1 Tax=mine drainage metagenome TaxID=410659 RepID=E6PSQ4_9ZZZZ
MDRLIDEGRLAAAAGCLADLNRSARASSPGDGDARLEPATTHARRLLSQLAPLFASVASQTRTEGGAAAWIEAWGKQILVAGLTDRELAHGLGAISGVMQSAGNPPLSFPLFLQACRPTTHLTGLDAEARQRHPLLLTRDLGKSESWCAARDRALARLRARNFASL